MSRSFSLPEVDNICKAKVIKRGALSLYKFLNFFKSDNSSIILMASQYKTGIEFLNIVYQSDCLSQEYKLINNISSSIQISLMYNNFYIPNQVEATQKLLTIGMDLYLQSNGERFGMIKQKLFELGSHFNVEDLNGNVMFFAQTKFSGLGIQFEVFDSQGNRIGTVVEEIVKSMFSCTITYTVYDPFGNQVAKTKEYQQVKTHVEVYNYMNTLEVKMEKTHIFKDKWTIEFFGNNIDRRLLIFFPAFISSKQEQQKGF